VVEDAFLADTQTCADQMCLDASSQLGVAGTVEVSTPTADLSGVVTPLPQSFTQATALLPQRCAERLQGQPVSTFVLAGRDSLPSQPGGVLPSPLSAEGKPAVSRSKRPLEHAFASPMRGFVDNGHPEQTRERHGQRFSTRVLGHTCTAQPAARRP
jgi:hypothetical protein